MILKIAFYLDQIDFRRRRRQKRARDERIHDKRVTEKTNRLIGKYPTANIHIESLNQFPNFQPSSSGNDSFTSCSVETEFLPLTPTSSSAVDECFEKLSLAGSSYSEKNNLNVQATNKAGPSFANVRIQI